MIHAFDKPQKNHAIAGLQAQASGSVPFENLGSPWAQAPSQWRVF